MSMSLRRRVLVWDDGGLLVVDSGLVQAHSFVSVFLGVIGGLFTGGQNVDDITGSCDTANMEHGAGTIVPNNCYDTGLDQLIYMGGQGDAGFGVLCGVGDSPETLVDLNLASTIPSSNLYPSNHYLSLFENTTTASLALIRSFSNLTDEGVDIRETGVLVRDLAIHWWWQIEGYEHDYPYGPIWVRHTEEYNWVGLIVRDVLGSAYTVPVGGAASVQYVLTIPKP